MYSLVHSTAWAKAAKKEEVSIALTLFTVEVYRECCRCGVGVSIENPLSSKIWEFFLVRELLSLPNSRFVAFDMCMYGSEYRKPTGILTNVEQLESLARRCTHAFRHTPASGSVRVRDGRGHRWIARTTQAGAYPPQLCSKWAGLLRGCATPAALARPEDAATLAHRFVADLEGLVCRGGRSKAHTRGAATTTEQQLRGSGDNVTTGSDSTLREAAKFLRQHRVTFGGSSGARGGAEGTRREGQ